jgi:large subunit ribosomal protein L19e
MKLDQKKELASKVLGIGKGRVIFNRERLDEIKEAITKQDIRDLVAAGTISIREVKGKRAVERRVNRRRSGSIRKKVRQGKREYILRTRKLRHYLAELEKQGKITREQRLTLRKQIKASVYRTKAHMKEHISSLEAEK